MSEIMELIIFTFLCSRAMLGVAHGQSIPLNITGMETTPRAQNPENNTQEPVVQDVQKNGTVDEKVPEIMKISARANNQEEYIQEADTDELKQRFGIEGGLNLIERAANFPMEVAGDIGTLISGLLEYTSRTTANLAEGLAKAGVTNYLRSNPGFQQYLAKH
ncbi:uncharacterized protein [Halyomorpha halys]|uniref:uncharacterized protein n=1 Tax=Halyomorpha halys TaxID=286706 RepID=UPI0006D51BFA|nr:uncharacterized protein LOC106679922 [Halyomorpha halys]